MKLLLVEDSKDIADVIFEYFERTGATMDYAANGNQGAVLAEKGSYDCIILDIMLPGMDGLSICQHLREQGNNTPIIILTARDTNEDILSGFNDGADDYVVKPFELEVLEARINAIIRRTAGIGFQKEYICGPLRINVNTRQIFRGNTLLRLNPTCYAILQLLTQKHPLHTTREEIERHIWNDEPPDEDVLRKHIYQLRKVVDKPFEQSIIKTLPKIGYVINFDS